MEQILEIREILISLYKKYETFIEFLLKFLLGVIIYLFISTIGFSSPAFGSITSMPLKLPYTLLMGVFFAILPRNVNYGLIIFNITIQFSSKIEVAAIICMALLLVFVFYGRIGGKESTLIIAMFFGYYFKIPYAVVIFAGLYMGLTSIIPVSIGALLWSLKPLALVLGETAETAGASIMDMPGTFSQLYLSFSSALKETNDWAVSAFVFAMVIIVVYVVSKLDIDYSKEIAILLGAAVNVVSFAVAVIAVGYETGVFSLILFSILSAGVVYVIKFFDIALDYQRAEKVEFEDDENYYYVKVIPKIIINKKQRTVKRIQSRDIAENDYSNFDEERY